MMTVISPFFGAPEQQDLIPIGENQEFRRHRRLVDLEKLGRYFFDEMVLC